MIKIDLKDISDATVRQFLTQNAVVENGKVGLHELDQLFCLNTAREMRATRPRRDSVEREQGEVNHATTNRS